MTCKCVQPSDEDNSVVHEQAVPRVAESLDDLRPGQIIVIRPDEPMKSWAEKIIKPLTDPSIFDEGTVIIVKDPHAEPVTVGRETFDRFAEFVDAMHQPSYLIAASARPFLDAARAIVDEVRRADA